MEVLQVLILVCCTLVISAEQYLGHSTPIHFNCTTNPATCVEPICGFTILGDRRMNISFGCTLLKPMRNVAIRLREYHMRPKSQWRSTSVDFTVEICALSEGVSNPMVKMFMPGIMDTLGQFVHPCPYEGLFAARNITFTSGSFMQMLPRGTKIRTEVKLLDKKYMNFATLYMYNQIL